MSRTAVHGPQGLILISRFFVFSVMLLVLGDSFAFWAGRRCSLDASVSVAGWRGGRISDDQFRRWAVAEVARRSRPRVLLIVGGNDIDQRSFNARQLMACYGELALGLLAAGAESVHLLPVPPRSSCRLCSASAFRRRRRLANLLLRRRYARPDPDTPIVFTAFTPSMSFIGHDGVHPSAADWLELERHIASVAAAPQ